VRALVAAAWLALLAPVAARADEQPFTTPAVDTKILAARCAEHVSLSALEDRDGVVGAYIVNLDILDSPVEYLDAHGQHLATFHIFAPEAERKKAKPIIDRYTKRFPVQKSLDCTPYVKQKPR
jgi:hypothetical protein